MAIARDQHGGAKFDALRLFGDAGESDPYVVAEGGNLGTPDCAKPEVFGKKRILDGSRAGRQAEVISQHGAFPEISVSNRHSPDPRRFPDKVAPLTGLGNCKSYRFATA